MRWAPRAWMRFENLWKCSTTRSSCRLICGKFHWESGETFDDPPNIVSAIPPLAFAS